MGESSIKTLAKMVSLEDCLSQSFQLSGIKQSPSPLSYRAQNWEVHASTYSISLLGMESSSSSKLEAMRFPKRDSIDFLRKLSSISLGPLGLAKLPCSWLRWWMIDGKIAGFSTLVTNRQELSVIEGFCYDNSLHSSVDTEKVHEDLPQ
ncbi:hypothetical protein Tco_0544746 [Tanacetum coccineum]